uniref:Uncharacterized protein n=1 Tax=Rhizophora mucronata TaxID=61149 RepID=A0A2P2NRY1_RHIMU
MEASRRRVESESVPEDWGGPKWQVV